MEIPPEREADLEALKFQAKNFVCESHPEESIAGFCSNDSELFCLKCIGAHMAHRAAIIMVQNSAELIHVLNMRQKRPKCIRRCHTVAEFYCMTCQGPVCRNCIMQPCEKASHEYQVLDQAYLEAINSFDHSRHTQIQVANDYNEIIDFMYQKNLQEFDSHWKKVEEQVEECRLRAREKIKSSILEYVKTLTQYDDVSVECWRSSIDSKKDCDMGELISHIKSDRHQTFVSYTRLLERNLSKITPFTSEGKVRASSFIDKSAIPSFHISDIVRIPDKISDPRIVRSPFATVPVDGSNALQTVNTDTDESTRVVYRLKEQQLVGVGVTRGFNHKLYVAGGHMRTTNSKASSVGTLYEMEDSCGLLTRKNDMIVRRGAFGFTAAPDNSLYAVAGGLDGKVINSCERYIIDLDEWHEIPPLPEKSSGCAVECFVGEEKHYAIYCFLQWPRNIKNPIYIYNHNLDTVDFAFKKWTTIAPYGKFDSDGAHLQTIRCNSEEVLILPSSICGAKDRWKYHFATNRLVKFQVLPGFDFHTTINYGISGTKLRVFSDKGAKGEIVVPQEERSPIVYDEESKRDIDDVLAQARVKSSKSKSFFSKIRGSSSK
eukprot:CAMPEP_0114987896 /NCGR_PEP_ID=MMETSP0216-20121206/9281_1 /TAXON_ID=223996 /ORGANISM="Protocruzia adherens, Strain Boccale" /LENGTH=601 /DNA_ID=CAMNT_0002350583 /DNA_START=893 /DNA_END=2698 /DNA_ORIENTATION=-